MRLIDADALKPISVSLDGKIVFVVTLTGIRNAPTVDAVEVVRCKDCKHSVFRKCNGEFVMISCKRNINLADETWFCADGERKENT